MEAFDFTYQFHGPTRQKQIGDVVELIKNYVIDYVFGTLEMNQLQVISEGAARQRSTGESTFYYLTDKEHSIHLHGQLLTGPDSIFANLPLHLKMIRGIVVYGYMEEKFGYDLKLLKKSILKKIETYSASLAKPEVVLFDTSTFFTKASQEEFKMEPSPTPRIKASPRIRDEYSNLVGGLIYQWFEALRQSKENVSEVESDFDRLFAPNDYFNLNNLDLTFYIKALNRLNEKSRWKIGGASFFISDFQGQKEQFLANVPFRDYRSALDDYIQEKESTQFFYEDFDREKAELTENRYLYFEYTYDYKGVCIQLLSEPQVSPRDQESRTPDTSGQMLRAFLPLAHATVFYEPEVGKNLSGCKVLEISPGSKPANEEKIQLYCFFTPMKVLKSPGLLISYVWRRRKSDSEYPIERGASQFYNLLLPLLEGRMRELLMPKLQDMTLFFARKVAITQIFSRNFSHHMGSHIHPRTKSEGLEARLRELLGDRAVAPQATRQFINWLRDYYSNYVTARNEFVADPFQASKNVHFYEDLVLPFVENMLVMDNLAASEGVCYKTNEDNRLKILVRYKGEFLRAKYELGANPSIRGTLAKGSPRIRYPDFFPYFIDLSR
ncbi:MAG: hypothetical protein ABIQ93_11270, partial [Saprospiraceae bacterium]